MTGSQSPSGRFEITISAWEARMSLWIETPTLLDRHSNEAILVFQDPNWSLDSATWTSDATVVLTLRKYPGNHRPTSLVATVDATARTATVEGTTVPLTALESLLDEQLTWIHAH